ncbi:hypothetical protein CO058_02510 [candidate division WWE3 bacterium CG_4_9_14_0_2_um_filter_35_11]|uniref:Uncharacterized protein n=1 Tax=candidate division WWE3 bacterium CG_4_9_14_0_2_um_filter_35_11 TaxID=1975077 RepID=A0A2M8ELN8_UNCKA|nr:MAG: hypothetical protein COV25_02770 [candidate division WWE3 bacterium CG10_big_fil_rev_8_21_14_0_10_35_32]PJC23607.1 MAG: hypothetical protein CO058_02510 [candidate division WWE3 bacterium CG_4_9_14_0_2_um_filter_35_11]
MGKTYTSKKIIGKTYARYNWATIVKEAGEGKVFYLTDREKSSDVVITSVKNFERAEGEKKTFSIENYEIFGAFADRPEMQDSVGWVRKRRSARRERVYE